MRKWFLVFVVGILVSSLITGCGRLRKSKKGPDELAALEEAAIKGEDIPLEGIPEGEFIEPESVGITGVFSDIYFDYDKSKIREEDYVVLDGIGDYMQKNPSVIIMIEGHCDERGSNEYNMALGEQRALSTRRYLVSQGIESGRLSTVSYGEEKPADAGHDESAWAKNRRAHFLVAK